MFSPFLSPDVAGANLSFAQSQDGGTTYAVLQVRIEPGNVAKNVTYWGNDEYGTLTPLETQWRSEIADIFAAAGADMMRQKYGAPVEVSTSVTLEDVANRGFWARLKWAFSPKT